MSDWLLGLSHALHILFWYSSSTWRFLFLKASRFCELFEPKIQSRIIWCFSTGCNLHHLRWTVTTDFNSAYNKRNSAFCCTVHISPDTDSHWEVKLAGLGMSDGRPCAQVLSMGQQIRAYQRCSLPTSNWAYQKLTFLRRILKCK
jgi:hypothetical protein